jgi:osmotically-inducible protein OsmY
VLVLAPGLMFSQAKKAAAPAAAQAAQDNGYNTNTWSQEDATRIVQAVRHKLLSLPNYGVFDSLSFGIQGKTITLHGYASRPVLKNDAQNAVKSIPGVANVQNDIKVLPLSPMDDNIRVGVYRRIYGQPALRKYTGSPVGFGMFPSVARMAGGITQDPPTGYHAIHIVVSNGHVTLTGVVNNETDANIASMQANSTPNVFSVDNELLFPGATQKEK